LRLVPYIQLISRAAYLPNRYVLKSKMKKQHQTLVNTLLLLSLGGWLWLAPRIVVSNFYHGDSFHILGHSFTILFFLCPFLVIGGSIAFLISVWKKNERFMTTFTIISLSGLLLPTLNYILLLIFCDGRPSCP